MLCAVLLRLNWSHTAGTQSKPALLQGHCKLFITINNKQQLRFHTCFGTSKLENQKINSPSNIHWVIQDSVRLWEWDRFYWQRSQILTGAGRTKARESRVWTWLKSWNQAAHQITGEGLANSLGQSRGNGFWARSWMMSRNTPGRKRISERRQHSSSGGWKAVQRRARGLLPQTPKVHVEEEEEKGSRARLEGRWPRWRSYCNTVLQHCGQEPGRNWHWGRQERMVRDPAWGLMTGWFLSALCDDRGHPCATGPMHTFNISGQM